MHGRGPVDSEWIVGYSERGGPSRAQLEPDPHGCIVLIGQVPPHAHGDYRREQPPGTSPAAVNLRGHQQATPPGCPLTSEPPACQTCLS